MNFKNNMDSKQIKKQSQSQRNRSFSKMGFKITLIKTFRIILIILDRFNWKIINNKNKLHMKRPNSIIKSIIYRTKLSPKRIGQ